MPTNWVTLTTADIEQELNSGELDEYRQHSALIEDPLPGIIADVSALCRGYVAVKWELEPAGIPEEIKTAAADLVIYRLCKRVHLRGDQDDKQRKDAADDAMKLLQAVAKGEFGDFGTPKASSRTSWGSDTRIATGTNCVPTDTEE